MTERNDKSCGWQFSRSGTLTKPIPPVCRLYTSDPFKTRDFIVLSVVCRGNPVPERTGGREGGREKERKTDDANLRRCGTSPKNLSPTWPLPISVSSFTLVLVESPPPAPSGRARQRHGTTRWHWDKFSATEVSNGKTGGRGGRPGPGAKTYYILKWQKGGPGLIMELVYGIIWGIYTRYIFFLSLSSAPSASNIEAGGPCMYTGALDALYRKSPCKHERPSSPCCPRRYRAGAVANILSILSHPIVSPDYQRFCVICDRDGLRFSRRYVRKIRHSWLSPIRFRLSSIRISIRRSSMLRSDLNFASLRRFFVTSVEIPARWPGKWVEVAGYVGKNVIRILLCVGYLWRDR